MTLASSDTKVTFNIEPAYDYGFLITIAKGTKEERSYYAKMFDYYHDTMDEDAREALEQQDIALLRQLLEVT